MCDGLSDVSEMFQEKFLFKIRGEEGNRGGAGWQGRETMVGLLVPGP